VLRDSGCKAAGIGYRRRRRSRPPCSSQTRWPLRVGSRAWLACQTSRFARADRHSRRDRRSTRRSRRRLGIGAEFVTTFDPHTCITVWAGMILPWSKQQKKGWSGETRSGPSKFNVQLRVLRVGCRLQTNFPPSVRTRMSTQDRLKVNRLETATSQYIHLTRRENRTGPRKWRQSRAESKRSFAVEKCHTNQRQRHAQAGSCPLVTLPRR
jgi:hypothetical protein